MHTDYKELKEYLLDAIAGDALGVLNAIGAGMRKRSMMRRSSNTAIALQSR